MPDMAPQMGEGKTEDFLNTNGVYDVIRLKLSGLLVVDNTRKKRKSEAANTEL